MDFGEMLQKGSNSLPEVHCVLTPGEATFQQRVLLDAQMQLWPGNVPEAGSSSGRFPHTVSGNSLMNLSDLQEGGSKSSGQFPEVKDIFHFNSLE